MTRHRMRVALAALLAASGLAGVASAQLTRVTETGSFAPLVNLPDRPFQFIESAIWQSGGTPGVGIEPSVFPYFADRLESGRDVRITSAAGVRITGSPSQRTQLDVLCYNTHLFGDELLGAETWADGARAFYMNQYVRNFGADVVCLQELWDEELVPVITPGSTSGFYGGDSSAAKDTLNSGLLTMAYGLNALNPAFNAFDDEAGEDVFSNKGFTRVTVVKNGIPITIYNTHTQSGSFGGTRQDQFAELAGSVAAFRVANPSHAILVMGDFNDVGAVLLPFFGSPFNPELRDTPFHTPNTADLGQCTTCADNVLRQYFSGGTTNTVIDFVLFADSLDNTTVIKPVVYDVIRPEIPQPFPSITEDGLTTRTLSDHEAIFARFEVYRR